MNIPYLVAHRGYAANFPENTLIAIEEALCAGACFIEFDIQLTRDLVPVLFHDEELGRTTGQSGKITEIDSNHLKTLDAGEKHRLGDKFYDIKIPTLADFVTLMKRWPRVTAFVEVKTESLDKFGISLVIDTVIKVLSPCLSRCILISYDEKALAYARTQGGHPIGWILTKWEQRAQEIANKLNPEYLICNHTKLPAPPEVLWPGHWQWIVYEVTEPQVALDLANRGIAFVETMEIGHMLEHPALSSKRCNDD